MAGKRIISTDGHYVPLLADADEQPSWILKATAHAPLPTTPRKAAAADSKGKQSGMDTSAGQGQLVYLREHAKVVQLWHAQRPLMIMWLVSSIAALVLLGVLSRYTGLLLTAEVAAVLGIIASVVQLCDRKLAASNVLELGAQMKLVFTCGFAASILNITAVCIDFFLLWRLNCDPMDEICMAVTKMALLFALGCLFQAVITGVVIKRTNHLMLVFEPESHDNGALEDL